LARHGIDDDALNAIGEIVHDIDLKDAKYGRDDPPGVQHVINGICMTTRDDEARIVMGSSVCDGLYAYFRSARGAVRKKGTTRRSP